MQATDTYIRIPKKGYLKQPYTAPTMNDVLHGLKREVIANDDHTEVKHGAQHGT